MEFFERIMLEKSVRRRFMLDFWMVNISILWMFLFFLSIRFGLNSSLGVRNREGLICKMEGKF